MNFDPSLRAQRRMVEALRDPARYPHPVSAVAVIETHISFVLLTGTFAYKIKKAVDLGFVDYTRLEQRRFFCAEELRLNRRLAPGLYLEVVAIGGTPADPRWQTGGEAMDYAVKMTEFAQADLLDRVLARDELTPRQVDALAATVAAFHGAAPRAAPGADPGSPAAVWAPVAANFARLRDLADPADRPALAALEAWSRDEYARLAPVLARRPADGWVRECHGDLHLGNMARVGGEPVIFDCIEFNPGLRWIDVVSDLAFLVMDLSERGRPDYAWRLLNHWLGSLGDYAGLDLLRFYHLYRALVRAKVAGIRAAQESLAPAERQAARAPFAAYLTYAATVIAPRPGFVLVTHGPAGAGKSTVAQALAENLGAVCLRSDVERKRLHGLAPLARSGSGIDTGLYAEAATGATYARLADLASEALAAGYPLIVDAACLRRWQRDRFRALAEEREVPFLILDCRAPRDVLQQRVATRAELGGDPSDATPAVLARQLDDGEPLGADERDLALPVDTTGGTPGKLPEAVRRRLG